MGKALGTRLRKAKKIHVCDWCGEDIFAGEKYYKWAWFEDCSAMTVKSHVICFEASQFVDVEDCWFDKMHEKGSPHCL